MVDKISFQNNIKDTNNLYIINSNREKKNIYGYIFLNMVRIKTYKTDYLT